MAAAHVDGDLADGGLGTVRVLQLHEARHAVERAQHVLHEDPHLVLRRVSTAHVACAHLDKVVPVVAYDVRAAAQTRDVQVGNQLLPLLRVARVVDFLRGVGVRPYSAAAP